MRSSIESVSGPHQTIQDIKVVVQERAVFGASLSACNVDNGFVLFSFNYFDSKVYLLAISNTMLGVCMSALPNSSSPLVADVSEVAWNGRPHIPQILSVKFFVIAQCKQLSVLKIIRLIRFQKLLNLEHQLYLYYLFNFRGVFFW